MRLFCAKSLSKIIRLKIVTTNISNTSNISSKYFVNMTKSPNSLVLWVTCNINIIFIYNYINVCVEASRLSLRQKKKKIIIL